MCGRASPGSRASIRTPAAFGRFFSPPAGAGKELAIMRSTLACGALVAALLGPPAAAAQGSFEGLVVYKVSNADGKSGLMRYYQLGNRTRQEFEMNDVAAVSDRKSTRLNSSHGYISYAVFCLKKKKKK